MIGDRTKSPVLEKRQGRGTILTQRERTGVVLECAAEMTLRNAKGRATRPFRKKAGEQAGIGFELPVQALSAQTEVAPNCTRSELSGRTALSNEAKEEEWLPGQDSDLQPFG